MLISRRDAIGDVILALPLCGIIKRVYPQCKITFLGRTYTRSIAMASEHVDDFLNYDDWNDKSEAEIIESISERKCDAILHLRPEKRIALYAKKAGIRYRVGTVNRVYHWFTCNKLVKLSRKNSTLHEAQLNIKLLKGVGIFADQQLNALPQYYGLKQRAAPEKHVAQLLSGTKFNLILHPKSHGNSKEWSLTNFSELINRLDLTVFNILISGSEAEKIILSNWISHHKHQVTDVSGLFQAAEFMDFVTMADGLIASSTGPLHIAAATGIFALGLYTDIKTKDGKRWGPVGKKAEYLECNNGDMDTITVDMVLNRVNAWVKQTMPAK